MLSIVYFSCACPQSAFDEFFHNGMIEKLPQAQRFNLMLINGLAANDGVNVYAISMPSFNYNRPQFKSFERTKYFEREVEYVIPGFTMGRKRRYETYANAKREVEQILKKCNPKSTVFIVDVLNQTLGAVARKVARKHNIRTVGIVSDVPTHRSLARFNESSKLVLLKYSLLSRLNLYLISKYDSYMLLTKEMNAVVNKRNRPFIVIEGMVEIDTKTFESDKAEYQQKVVLYAGGVHKEFGIALLVEAFLQANIPNTVFRIYGNGNYMDELSRISKDHVNIEFLGTTTVDKIHEEQRQAYLLVNPRLTEADYVKYSFPSKTQECMASGTPLLTTRLPAMPLEYYPHVYFFEPETRDGFCNSLTKTLAIPPEMLHEKGKSARAFILQFKNNVVQAEKLLTFIQNI